MTGNSQIVIRDAEAADLAALVAVRPPEALHRGRLRDAQRADYRYFVVLRDHEIIGFCSLVFRRPPTWSNANDEQHLPQIVDLHIAEAQRGQGYGSEAIRAMEHITSQSGYSSFTLPSIPSTIRAPTRCISGLGISSYSLNLTFTSGNRLMATARHNEARCGWWIW